MILNENRRSHIKNYFVCARERIRLTTFFLDFRAKNKHNSFQTIPDFYAQFIITANRFAAKIFEVCKVLMCGVFKVSYHSAVFGIDVKVIDTMCQNYSSLINQVHNYFGYGGLSPVKYWVIPMVLIPWVLYILMKN